ncbi:IS1/IS1595 family N-terminal zinc-binding domain-containing protein [Budvicia aquatica]|uniref:Transposase and inactivated derivatives n=1 Tax=Budvicia aquatica TaxID=82979 RepID=A0A2C6DL50_9GAMM|nr:IS1 family transposase [Budvicia aquatica]PHI29423.1 hypothetical protein CRN84_08820 [Budvicia aquatica]
MIRLNPECPHCHQKDAIRKHGTSKIGLQRYLCRRCNKTFQARYYYRAHDHNLSRQIGELAQNGWSSQKIGRHLRISVNTVNRRLKNITTDKDYLVDKWISNNEISS